MRDPNRIEPFLNKIRYIWNIYPDLRFTQLFEILKQLVDKDDMYYVEDDILESKIDSWIKEIRKGLTNKN